MYDTVSGIEGTDGYINGEISSVIRYPKSITLKVSLDPDQDEMIYPPILIIEYREKAKTVIDQSNLASVSFTSEYSMNTGAFWKVAKILFIVFNIFFGVLLVAKMIIWCLTPQLSEVLFSQY